MKNHGAELIECIQPDCQLWIQTMEPVFVALQSFHVRNHVKADGQRGKDSEGAYIVITAYRRCLHKSLHLGGIPEPIAPLRVAT
jgi:hypothetical protein